MPWPPSVPKNVKQNQAVLAKAKLVCDETLVPPRKLSTNATGNRRPKYFILLSLAFFASSSFLLFGNCAIDGRFFFTASFFYGRCFIKNLGCNLRVDVY